MTDATPMMTAEQILSRERARGRRLAYERERPRVSAHAGKQIAEEVRREAAKMRARLDEAAKCGAACPAAELLGNGPKGVTVRCGVERSLVTQADDPSSLVNFCLQPAGYPGCPSWRAEKEREWHGKRSPLVAQHEGV